MFFTYLMVDAPWKGALPTIKMKNFFRMDLIGPILRAAVAIAGNGA